MENINRKELKTVLSPELYDELRFSFRPEVLENIIYLPEMYGEVKWQCCCGSVNELDVCPICGMEKNTAFSKVNAAYLARHRKARIARKRKAMQDQQAMMAAQILKKNKKPKKDYKKLGTLIGLIILCLAIVLSVVIIFGGKGEDGDGKKPIGTTINLQQTEAPDTDAPETTAPDEDVTDSSPEATTEPETEPVIPETTAPVVPVQVPITNTTGKVSTIGDGKWAAGASGNVSAGGLVFSAPDYDYIAKDGITVLDKSGNFVTKLTDNTALGITGSGTYIFYIDEGNHIHRIDITTKEDTAFATRAKTVCVFMDELYYIPAEGNGLAACNFYGDTTKYVTTMGVYALNCTADKLFFSTDESLAVITTEDGSVTTFCPDGAKATSIMEITECIFYTGTDGRLKFYNPAISATFGVEYPRYNVAITHVSSFDNRVYIRTVDQYTKAVLWFSTKWTPGTKLFNPNVFTSTGVTTDSLYVTNNAIFDGALNRIAVW